ncbi:MAG: DDE-type integrase/transposase/recombinase [Legionella sp.]|nr:DDE-type integrase/transposase/recombinase [Legionella sp.]
MMDSNGSVLIEQGLLSASDSEWNCARLRTEIIAPLAQLKVVTWELADNTAEKLGLSRRQIYALIKRYRHGQGLVSDMLLNKSHGGKGNSRLPEAVEQIIREVLRSHYLNKQKLSETVIWNEIKQRCRKLNLSVPALNTVRLRIQWLDPYVLKRKREGIDAARTLQSAGGVPPAIVAPLEQVQIDHTIIDIMIVDDSTRQSIGRPYITVAIDVFSRCLIGMLITLEAPSAVSVGLCLAHAVCDKRPWLERLGLDIEWPMTGKPLLLYIDNGAEFKSEALRRGCEQHGIALDYRPLGKTHYGGIIERVIGTLMQKIHELPGTTFSNPSQKGDYDSEAKAALTLNELECWLVLAVNHYHGSIHHTLNQTPGSRWSDGIAQFGNVPTVTNPRAFLIDFLPVLRRQINRGGFLVDHIAYYADVLKPWIANRHQLQKFIIRRNPLDLSRIWVLDPDGKRYIEIPYRVISRPALTLWEHRQAMDRLRAKGRSQIDETMLFSMVSQMREITKTAQSTTRKTRRNQQRLSQIAQLPIIHEKTDLKIEPPVDITTEVARPFDQIEEW